MTGTMRPQLLPPLAPFVDPLPLARRILAGQHGGELTVRIRAAAHLEAGMRRPITAQPYSRANQAG